MFVNEIFVFVGPNGCGKSTLAHTIAGMNEVEHGKIMFNGHNILHNVALNSDLIGYCPQTPILLSKYTVYDNLKYFCLYRDMENIAETIQKTLITFQLETNKDVFVSQLSIGNQQLLSLALATLGDSQIIILDEPT
jgi:ABC-type multidrug transport system ATPase subunit